jgi:hypothetical protein
VTPDSAQLDRFVGPYAVEGHTPDDQIYRGQMNLIRKGAYLHAAAKLDEPVGIRFGLAMPFAGRLVMAFGARDKVEIGAYRIEEKNVTGMWVPPGAKDDEFAKCGREGSVLEAPGVWKITKAHAVDQSAYTGTVRVTPMDAGDLASSTDGTPVKMTWSLHDGEYHSFGLAYGDAVYSTFNLARGEPHGIAVYTAAGDVLNGVWLSDGNTKLGSEMLRRL